jgi:Spy/CpxP family protein refolding chaperone
MRTLGRSLLALAVAVVVASPAIAQQRGFGGGFGGAGLLMNEGVQKELKLDEGQIAKAREVGQSIREKFRPDFQNFQSLSPEERRELGEKMNAETRKALADVLKPEQMKRFEQIQLQQRGVDAFASPDVQSKLSLTDEQKQKIQSISEDSRQQVMEAFQSAGDDRQGAMAKITTIRREAMTKASALLTADQKKSWEELIGAPFEVRFQPRNRQPN